MSYRSMLTNISRHLQSEYLLFYSRCLGRRQVMHHGLQRSGTNYLLLWLRWHNVPVVNYRDPKRSSPLHKHCRWQSDKETLIEPIRQQYGNEFKVTSADEIDQLCGLKGFPMHIVIFKEMEDWVKSAANWGLRCNWFSDRQSAILALKKLAADYQAYREFWECLAQLEPKRTMLVSFSKLISEPESYQEKLAAEGLITRLPAGQFTAQNVPQSPRGRPSPITLDDVRSELNR